MQNAWVGLALPFCMIGFWVVVAAVDMFRTPNTTHNTNGRFGQDATTLGSYKTVSR